MGALNQACGQQKALVGAGPEVEKCQEQIKYESQTLDQLFQEELDRLVSNHEKLSLARKRVPTAMLSKTRKELAEMGLDFQVWSVMR